MKILTEPKNALVPQYQMLFGMDKVFNDSLVSLKKWRLAGMKTKDVGCFNIMLTQRIPDYITIKIKYTNDIL